MTDKHPGHAAIAGGCHCGRVRYRADGEALLGLVCHCRDCQKISGSSGVPVMVVKAGAFRIEGEVRGYATIGGSGRQAVRHFCPNCGSLLYGKTAAVPGIVTIYAGTLDDPHRFEPGYAQFTRDRPRWVRMDGSLAEHETLPPH